GGVMTGFVQDIRYALRALARAPGFSAVAILTLGLGIGATTIVFSLVDGILLKPLPIVDPDRVVLARSVATDKSEMSVSFPDFQDWVARARWCEKTGPRGGTPRLGRKLPPADDQPGVDRVALVSYGFWQRELGGDASAIGRRITLD